MDIRPTEKKPTWWLLYTLGAALVGSIAVIETSVPSGVARLVLELGAAVALSVFMLAWLRSNRGRIELSQARRTPGAISELAVAARSVPRHNERDVA